MDSKSALTFEGNEIREPKLVLVDENIHRLEGDWVIIFRDEEYIVPDGMLTDGASIPTYLQWLCGSPFKQPRLKAALVHDFLYGGGDPEATRKDADDLYRDLQISFGIPKWKAWTEWIALRLCGSSHWHGKN